MPASIPANRLHAARLQRSEHVLLLADCIRPVDFPGGDKLAPLAVAAPARPARQKSRKAAHA